MRPALVAWLAGHGLPGWLAPDYFVLVAGATILAAAIALRLARSDGAPVEREARTIALAYLAALAGGYVFEGLRLLPAAIAARSLAPFGEAGRAAYGGLLGAMLAVFVYLRSQRAPVAAFLDRASVGTGIVFAFVRTGCFLAGCDYGRPTAGPFGVRFPGGSLAALDHAERGWIRSGAPSLPVHPTELYEAAVGLAGAALALWVLRRGRRDGRAFLAWISVYAVGRFAVELLRGDDPRGLYAGLSTGQWVSLAILAVAIPHMFLKYVKNQPVTLAICDSPST